LPPGRRTLSTVTSRPAAGPRPGAPEVEPEVDPEDGHGYPPGTADPHRPTPDGPVADPAAGVAALVGDLPAERHRLAPTAIRYWRWRIIFSSLPLVLLLVSLAIVLPWGDWWMRWGVVGVAVVLLIIGMVILPPIRYRVFWYAISPTEIDVQHGAIFIKRSVVPMHRVQSLRTERGPMADHYRMTNLKIRTAAGSVNLSGLGRTEADDLCDRISRLADVADDV
jgi:membrane protein YdbS with pleckstrin-like domain